MLPINYLDIFFYMLTDIYLSNDSIIFYICHFNIKSIDLQIKLIVKDLNKSPWKYLLKKKNWTHKVEQIK